MTWWTEGGEIWDADLRASVLANTLDRFNERWLLQGIANVPAIARSLDVDSLRSLGGLPAVIVSPGPSLDCDGELLRRVARRVVVIAASHSLRALRRMGVRPDLVVSLDAEPSDHFAGVSEHEFGGLVLSAVADPALFQRKPGRRWVHLAAGAEWLCAAYPDSPVLQSGGCVSGLALSLALHAGCWPIALVGQDLALTDDGHLYSAASQDAMTVASAPDAGGWFTATCTDGGELRALSVTLPGLHGAPVKSHRVFQIYRDWFAHVARRVFERRGVRIVNCTSFGARIDHCEEIPLNKWIARTPQPQGWNDLVVSTYATGPVDSALASAAVAGPHERRRMMNAHLCALRVQLARVETAAQVCALIAEDGSASALEAAEAVLRGNMGVLGLPISALRLADFMAVQRRLLSAQGLARLRAARALYQLMASAARTLSGALPETC